VGVASTGIIGVPLPIRKVEEGIELLTAIPLSKNGDLLAEAILTTDLCVKQVTLREKIGKKNITITGITKGSGMIAPNMATTLSFIVTNADIPSNFLQVFLNKAIEMSLNMMSVDTDTSTNDLALLFSTGEYKFSIKNSKECQQFQDLLTQVCIKLSQLIAKDGEGARCVIHCQVINAASVKDAKMLAKSVIDSPLVKTAIHGANPNWGRVASALGKVEDVKLNPNKVSISFSNICVFKNGKPIEFNKENVSKEMKKEDVFILIDLNLGKSSASAWGCDLGKGYIDINTTYS
jgi:glutamate N-acetyltransferase/amino-acid N-acetyltransferase